MIHGDDGVDVLGYRRAGAIVGQVPEAIAGFDRDGRVGDGLRGVELGGGECRQRDHEAEARDRDQRIRVNFSTVRAFLVYSLDIVPNACSSTR